MLEELELPDPHDLYIEGWRIARSFLLRNPGLESDYKWMYAAPMVYWPAVSRYYSNNYYYITILLHFIVNVSSNPSSHDLVEVFCYRGHWLTSSELIKLLETDEDVTVKLSYTVTLREVGQQAPGSFRCVAKHELMHPMFRNNQQNRFEVHLPNVDHNAYWALHTFMDTMECGYDRSVPRRLGPHVAGVVLTRNPVNTSILTRSSYPLMLTMDSLSILLQEQLKHPSRVSEESMMHISQVEFNSRWEVMSTTLQGILADNLNSGLEAYLWAESQEGRMDAH
jgi:hypothetical protein